MDWNVILNQYVYPALFGLILILVSIGLKMLALWLKTLSAKTDNELLRMLVANAVFSVEQASANAEKAGNAKWTGDTKKDLALSDAKVFIKDKGLVATDIEINKMIESVLGEKKL